MKHADKTPAKHTVSLCQSGSYRIDVHFKCVTSNRPSKSKPLLALLPEGLLHRDNPMCSAAGSSASSSSEQVNRRNLPGLEGCCSVEPSEAHGRADELDTLVACKGLADELADCAA